MSHVLVVDDEASMRAALDANFRRSGWQVSTAGGVAEALAKFRSAPCGLVVTDMRMGDGDGLAVMQGVRQIAPETAVILPDRLRQRSRSRADHEGGRLRLPDEARFLRTARRSRATHSRPKPPTGRTQNAPEFVGESAMFQALIAKARRVALTDADILIEAESGTGKELLARLIHRASPRAAKPFVAVNCSAFPENLLESELFGHVRGAFTGAIAAKPGKFQVADGGTLLLDEIGEMPLSLQPKLLRVLQEREIDRLGDTRPLPINVRVIATTNRSLPALIEAGTFRADLYYRLNVIPSFHSSAAASGARTFWSWRIIFCASTNRRRSAGNFSISPELAAALQEYDWPGNVRELAEFYPPRAGSHAQHHSRRRSVRLGHATVANLPSPAALPQDPGVTLQDLERSLLEATLLATERKSHAHGGDDGRQPAHGPQQNSRIWSGCEGGGMSWIDSAQVDLLERYLDLSAKRQALITSNIANVDTPGYRTKDIDFQGELQRALQGESTSRRPNRSCAKCRA